MAKLELKLEKMKHLREIVWSDIEYNAIMLTPSDEVKKMLAFKKSILNGIDSAIAHAEAEELFT